MAWLEWVVYLDVARAMVRPVVDARATHAPHAPIGHALIVYPHGAILRLSHVLGPAQVLGTLDAMVAGAIADDGQRR